MSKPISQDLQQRTCEYCQATYRAGELFCEVCGNALHQGSKTQPTRPPEFDELLQSDGSNEIVLAEDQPLIIHIIEADTMMVTQPQDRITLGRSPLIGAHSHSVDVDFVTYDGFAKGVSQVHALVLREENGVFLIDQGSKNGTLLNGVPLKAQQPYQLQDGDIVYLGKMPIRFSFS